MPSVGVINRLRRLDIAKIILIIALLLGIVLRVNMWQQGEGNNIFRRSRDSVAYDAIARNLLAGKGYVGTTHMIERKGQPTAFYGPIYPFYLVAIYTVFGRSVKAVQLSHMIISLATVVLLYILGEKVYGKMAGALAALIFALSPQIAHYSFYLMSDTLDILLEILLLILIVAFLRKERPSMWVLGGTGLLLGIAYLCRQTVFFFPVILIPIMWLRYRNNGRAWLLKSVAVLTAGILLAIAPWVIRNYIVFKEPLVETTTGPATLWWGTLEDKGTPLKTLVRRYRNDHPDMNEVQMSHLMAKEAETRLFHMTKGEVIERIEQRPRRLFGFPWPLRLSSPQMRVGISYALLGLLGTIGLFVGIRGKYDRVLIGLYAVMTMGLHLSTHTVFRYLMPVVPFLALGSVNLLFYAGSYIKQLLYNIQGKHTATI